MPPWNFTPLDLMRGGYYAIEQAGYLLRDAVSLYRSKCYASAVVLAVLSIEEIGRAEIYFEQRRAILPDSLIESTKLMRACKNHEEKLRKGRITMTVSLPYIDDLGARGEALKKLWKKRPKYLHARRIRSLYVEPRREGEGWSRPCEVSESECKKLLWDAANNYAFYARFHFKLDNELVEALRAWHERPTLLEPAWPPE